MRSSTSSVSMSTTSSALKFSSSCSRRLAPVMTVLTFGFLSNQAMDICARLTPRSSAIKARFSTACMRAGSLNISFSHSKPGRLARVPSGKTPPRYLPLSMPDLRGLQVVVPRPSFLYKMAYSSSKRLRCSRLYSGCSMVGPIR